MVMIRVGKEKRNAQELDVWSRDCTPLGKVRCNSASSSLIRATRLLDAFRREVDMDHSFIMVNKNPLGGEEMVDGGEEKVISKTTAAEVCP
jgi:hypothetical protein